jgi:hypothetical protein
MKSTRARSLTAHRPILGIALVLATCLAGALAPHTIAAGSHSAHATSRPVAAVTTSSVSYHLAAQILTGSGAGSTVAGQVAGTMDSTGVLTATLTIPTGATATVTGTFTGTSALAHTQLRIKGKAGNMTLSGGSLNKGANVIWGGMIQRGTTSNAGSWLLTPETQTVSFSLGGKSVAGSKHKLALAAAVTLQLTPDGWGDGTLSFLNNDTVLQAVGRVSNGNVTATVFWPKMGGNVMLVATGKPAVGVTKWTGTFVGPAEGDSGTFIAEG